MKIKIIILVVFGIAIISPAYANPDYINSYLPNNSLIKQRHNAEGRSNSWFDSNSAIRKSCDRLNNLLKHAHNGEISVYGYLAAFATLWIGGSREEIPYYAHFADSYQTNQLLHKTVNTILADQSEDIRRKEICHIYSALASLKKEYMEIS